MMGEGYKNLEVGQKLLLSPCKWNDDMRIWFEFVREYCNECEPRRLYQVNRIEIGKPDRYEIERLR